SPSILISVPPYFEISTLSPDLTVKSTFLPLSSILPVPRATTLPSCGFSFAVSGIMIPPFFVSVSSIGCTSTRSPSGLTLTDAIIFFFTPLFDLGLLPGGARELSSSDQQIVGYFFLSSSTTSNSASTTSPLPARAPAPCSAPGRGCASGPGCGPACAPAPADACL